ncbi:hypothetical protein BDN72DRAFT_362541 [Pluteus cervinus]|uniref:Uncharacterized protein n=1 Tax=Pluteus cervinus TaxID=181527 RepID=A0ACD3BCZ7_9AGAR|nr:hypothetical protein BDN72DRAFT_362541 [Pluteus cervinus]
MSFVELRVELPAYAHSFLIHVPIASTIAEVKQEIFRTCIGGPRAEGQRIIWRGRYLVDHEKVEELWKSRDEPRIIHLAVHPSAWSSKPPEVSKPPPDHSSPPNPSRSVHASLSPANSPPSLFSSLSPQPHTAAQPSPSPLDPVVFIRAKHNQAVHALMNGNLTGLSANPDTDALRPIAKEFVERSGYTWATILDEPFPPPSIEYLKYEQVTLEGQSYLTLRNPLDEPSPIQRHALQVLTYTFPLLSLPPQPLISNYIQTPTFTTLPPPQINELLQRLGQLGVPPLRAAADRNQGANARLIELREIPLRPLMAPFLLLIFRTLLLLYFVAPARKPIFGILVFAWMLWEIWVPIRNGLLRGLRRAAADGEQRQNGDAAPPVNPVDANGVQPQLPRQRNGALAGGIDQQAAAVFDSLGTMNIQDEERLLNLTNAEEPGIGHKIMTFFSLLITTTHPAVWDRRRVALRQREGRIRTEANGRAPPPPNENGEALQDDRRTQTRDELVAQHGLRAGWVRRYIERVVTSDWIDDAD